MDNCVLGFLIGVGIDVVLALGVVEYISYIVVLALCY